MNTEAENKTNKYLKGIVANLPEKPGIYQYLNAEGTIIYVGKAKNLKKRVYSYFSKEHEPGKTRVLVSKIADIRYIVVNTEEDALLLENNLIKKYKPRYNVLLKDDKTYPSICVQNEYFPRIFRTRKIIRNGSSYYGPYSHIPSMYAVLDLYRLGCFQLFLQLSSAGFLLLSGIDAVPLQVIQCALDVNDSVGAVHPQSINFRLDAADIFVDGLAQLHTKAIPLETLGRAAQ